MSEKFLNRIDAQRALLKIINSARPRLLPLYSLSSSPIDRWQIENLLPINDEWLEIARRASEELFNLANRSQEQITPEYQDNEASFHQILADAQRLANGDSN